MPLYDYECNSCKKVFEALAKADNSDAPVCESCGGSTRRLVSRATYHKFPEGFWPHLDIDDIYVSSRKQLKRECEKRGLSSVYLLDS